jgi:hypothetical protein
MDIIDLLLEVFLTVLINLHWIALGIVALTMYTVVAAVLYHGYQGNDAWKPFSTRDLDE